jgi:hypothetical protein
MLKDKLGVQPELREIVMDAEANLAGGAVLADVITKINNLLAKLRAAGLMKS